MAAADVVLMRDSLEDVVVAFHISRVTFRRILLNFVWAYGYNIVRRGLGEEGRAVGNAQWVSRGSG